MFTKVDKRKFKLVLFIQIGILLAIWLGVFFYNKQNSFSAHYKGSASQYFSVYGMVDEKSGGYYVDESFGTQGLFTCGPYSEIPQGIYDITIYYESVGSGHYCYAYTEDGVNYAASLDSDRVELDSNHTVKTFTIWVDRDLQDFEVQTEYGGNGNLLVKEIFVSQSNIQVLHQLFFYTFLLIIIDVIMLLWWTKKKNLLSKHTIMTGIALAGIICFASAPLFRKGLLNYSTDLNFILMRIDGLKDGILSGEFPVRIQPNWLNGYGYATSVFYGDLFLVIPAFFRIVGFSVQDAYHIYVFCINAATCLISYFCIKGIFHRRAIGIIGSTAYTLSTFRIMFIYVTSRGGMYTAYTFLPLIAYGMYLLYYDSKNRKSWICISLGMTGIMQSHLLTSEMTVLAMAMILLVSLRRFLNKNSIITMVKAVMASVMLNIGFLVPLLDYMGDGFYVSSDSWKAIYGYIQKKGEDFSGFFSLFREGNSYESPDIILLFGLVVFAGILLLIPVSEMKKELVEYRKIGIVTSLVSIALIFMGTKYFPWDFIEEHLAFTRMPINSIQYPCRFYEIATILMVITLCCDLVIIKEYVKESDYKNFVVALCGGVLISSGWLISNQVNHAPAQEIYDTVALDTCRISTKEYLPEGANPDLYINEYPVLEEGLTLTRFERDGLILRIGCINESAQGVDMELPLVYYNDYQAIDANGAELSLSASDNFAVVLKVPENYAGDITVRFKEPISWTITFWISVLSAVTLMVTQIMYRQRAKKTVAE